MEAAQLSSGSGSLWMLLWRGELTLFLLNFKLNCNVQGHLRKDLNWVPPMNATQGQSRERRREASGSEGEKQKKRRQKKSGKNSKPALTIGLPTFGVNGSQVKIEGHKISWVILSSQINVKRSDAQGIPPAGGRQRTNSVSSTNSGS